LILLNKNLLCLAEFILIIIIDIYIRADSNYTYPLFNLLFMKKLYLTILTGFSVLSAFAQNSFPTSGPVAIGTSDPKSYLSLTPVLSIGTNIASVFTAGEHGVLGNGAGSYLYPFEFQHTNYANVDRLQIAPYRRIAGTSWEGTGYRLQFAVDNSFTDGTKAFVEMGASDASVNGTGGGFISLGTEGLDRLVVTKAGYVGIGTALPEAQVHVLAAGSSLSDNAIYNGDLIVEARPGNRNANAGASLEFVIPANTDGNNPWGQGRIITVPGNNLSSSATGKMVLGTRRLFDKSNGLGINWNYGDDIVIDGSGRVGIGTLNPTEALAVNGTIHSKSVRVDNENWPDYVFEKKYNLMPLGNLEK